MAGSSSPLGRPLLRRCHLCIAPSALRRGEANHVWVQSLPPGLSKGRHASPKAAWVTGIQHGLSDSSLSSVGFREGTACFEFNKLSLTYFFFNFKGENIWVFLLRRIQCVRITAWQLGDRPWGRTAGPDPWVPCVQARPPETGGERFRGSCSSVEPLDSPAVSRSA